MAIMALSSFICQKAQLAMASCLLARASNMVRFREGPVILAMASCSSPGQIDSC
jgi:hypothetical protein